MDNRYFDRKGKAITLLQWAKLFETKDYKIIKQQYTDNKKYWVSTVWLGMNHNWVLDEPPIIFETMVFPQTEDDMCIENDCERYSTEEEAIKGHEKIFNKWNKKED